MEHLTKKGGHAIRNVEVKVQVKRDLCKVWFVLFPIYLSKWENSLIRLISIHACEYSLKRCAIALILNTWAIINRSVLK